MLRALVVTVTAIFFAAGAANAASEDQARLTCGALMRQLVASPVSFREVGFRILSTASPGLFDVVLRFDSANQFNAVMRNNALCKFNREADLPYMIEFEKEKFGLEQIETLWQMHADEMKSRLVR